MRVTVPTMLTLLRLLAAPAVPMVFIFLPRPIGDWLALLLFLVAAMTDWIDGRLARAWGQITRLGTMLDPIADKTMVAAALVTLSVVSSLGWPMMLPAVLILFREVVVSGLREFLGRDAGALKVTVLAKWKTTVQMTAIAILFAHGVAEHHVGMAVMGMDGAIARSVLAGEVADVGHLRFWVEATRITAQGGLALVWLAAVLTLWTGADYFRKAVPFLKEPE